MSNFDRIFLSIFHNEPVGRYDVELKESKTNLKKKDFGVVHRSSLNFESPG